MVEENKLYFRNGWKTKVTRTLNAFVGHSPGIGYPSLCFIPDKHETCHSKASNFGKPTPKTVVHFLTTSRLLGTLRKHDDERNQKAKKETFKEQKQWPCECGKISSFVCRHLQSNVKLPNLKLNAFATDYFPE